jgi:methionyl-tRNA formyltransferase
VTLRIAFFGAGGPFSKLALDAVRNAGEVVAVVVPSPRGWLGRVMSRFRRAPLACANAATIRFERPQRVAERLAEIAPDLIVVASFPRILGKAIRSTARLGAINAHLSLLPRHRGPDPLFWTYFHGDETTGVTIHRIDDGVDTGPILAQRERTIARGTPGAELYLTLAGMAASMLGEAVAAIESATATERQQRDEDASAEKRPGEERWTVDYAVWSAERLHHFLRGVEHRPDAEIPDARGVRHRIGRVAGWRKGPAPGTPGSIEHAGGRLTISCIDGVVECSG